MSTCWRVIPGLRTYAGFDTNKSLARTGAFLRFRRDSLDLDRLCRNSADNVVCRHILGGHSDRTHHPMLADSDAAQYRCMISNPCPRPDFGLVVGNDHAI